MGVAAYNRGSAMIRGDNDAADKLKREREVFRRQVGHEAIPVTAPSVTTSEWQVGDDAYCIVHGGFRGWYIVRAVRGHGKHQQLKVFGVGSWCPGSNFRRESPIEYP